MLLEGKIEGKVALERGQTDDVVKSFAKFMLNFLKKISDGLVGLERDLADLLGMVAYDESEGVGQEFYGLLGFVAKRSLHLFDVFYYNWYLGQGA